MAIKDWKKRIWGSGEVRFKRQDGNNEVRIIKGITMIGTKYNVYQGKTFANEKLSKSFKTKSQALAHARAYMRKH